jgi:hypothetical protein
MTFNDTLSHKQAWDDSTLDEKKMRVKSITYKIYTLCLCVIIYFWWPLLNDQITKIYGDGFIEWYIEQWGATWPSLITSAPQWWSWMLAAQNYWWLWWSLYWEQKKHAEYNVALESARQENLLITWLMNPRTFGTLKECVHDNNCDRLSQLQRDRLNDFRVFYWVGAPMPQGTDMLQKRILRHLQETLLVSPQQTALGRMRSLHFWWIQKLEQTIDGWSAKKWTLFALPIHVTLEFTQQERLLLFLKNVEQGMGKRDDSIYLHIDTITYDLGQNTLIQTMEATFTVLFYEIN